MDAKIEVIPELVQKDIEEIGVALESEMKKQGVTAYRFIKLGVRESTQKLIFEGDGGNIKSAATMANALGMKLTVVKQEK